MQIYLNMGIRGLTGCIKWAASPGATVPNWTDFKGKQIGIDILGFLYKAKSQQSSIFRYLTRFIIACKKHDIIPVPIFDGKPPEEKRNALKQRSALRIKSDVKQKALEHDLEHIVFSDKQKTILQNEIRSLQSNSSYLTSEERDQAKQFFYACGILSLNAAGEADNVLAYFAKRDMLAAVISNDLDLLCRGVELLLVPDTYALPGDTSGWTQYSLKIILESTGFRYDQFVEMCVLMGCDYTATLRSLPYKNAYWAIKRRGTIDKTLALLGIMDTTPYIKAVNNIVGYGETMDTLMGVKQWDKWTAGAPQSEPLTLLSLRNGILTDIDEVLFMELTCSITHNSSGIDRISTHHHPEDTHC